MEPKTRPPRVSGLTVAVIAVPIALVIGAWLVSIGPGEPPTASIVRPPEPKHENPAPTVHLVPPSPEPPAPEPPTPPPIVPSVFRWRRFPVTPSPGCAASAAEIDMAAAIAALKSVAYKSCGGGGPGKIDVTFGKSGSVTGASVIAGSYSAATSACIAARFGAAKIPPFCEDPKTFAWSIDL